MTDTITREQVEQYLMEACVGPEEAALMLNVSASHFRNLVSDGIAPAALKNTGTKSAKYPRREIEALADERHKAMVVLQAERDAAKAKRKAAAKAGRVKVTA